MTISSPTGSGKTVLFELGLVRLYRACIDKRPFPHGSLKAIYLAPLKVLCELLLIDPDKLAEACAFCVTGTGFRKVYRMAIKLTGDNAERFNFGDYANIDVLCTTAEKLDSVTRKYKDQGGMGFFSEIGLVCIDEVHMVGDSRGAALEALVSRLKFISALEELKAAPLSRVRFIAASATIGNIEDVASWLGCPESGRLSNQDSIVVVEA
eukprot:scaffold655_cov379-Prasinococcus_capsulatus_cf.AAC.23